MASSSRTDAPGVLALDSLADRLLAASGHVRVSVAESPAEVEAVQRLRYEQVVADGWADPRELSAGIEGDAYDEHSVQIGAWDGTGLAGTVRLVIPRPGRRLPVEDAFGLEVEPAGEVVEIGRLVVARAHRGDPAHRIWGALFARAWIEVRSRGSLVMAGVASAGMVARYRSLGLPFEVLGPARPYWGVPRHPVRLDVSAAAPRWYDGA